ncbi:MAG: 50S ribosomal protein L9 [Candidatus Moraniibacteriota bacterium]
MKVVLKQEVKGVGRAGEVKNVADGYAMNFLFPKKMAEPATEATLARIASDTARKAAAKETAEAEVKAAAKALAGARLVIKAKTKDRKLFGSIDAAGVAAAITKKGITGVMERNIVLPKSIKETGEFPVEANFGTAKAKFLVAVEAEG